MNQVFQLVYTSLRTEICTDADIQLILEASQRNNSPQDITGILLLAGNTFIQCLEGDKEAVMALYHKIAQDKRHSNCFLMSSKEVEERSFPTWTMGYRDLSKDAAVNFKDSNLSTSEQLNFRQILKGENIEQSQAIKTMLRLFQISR